MLSKTKRMKFFLAYSVCFFIILPTVLWYMKFLTFKNYFSVAQTKIKYKTPRIFCSIISKSSDLNRKALLLYKTWGVSCDKIFFITKFTNGSKTKSIEKFQSVPTLQPAGLLSESYGELTTKVFLMFEDIYARYDDYDWYLKADMDTYIFVDNLKEFLSKQDPKAPVTFGYDFKTIVEHGYHSGGAGYVLSREALKRFGSTLAKNKKFCKNSGIEDVDVGKCLRRLGVYPNKSIDSMGRERFHPLSVQDHYNGNFPDWMYTYASNPLKNGTEAISLSSISFHYMDSKSIQKLHKIWKSNKQLDKDKKRNLHSILLDLL